MPRPRPPCRVDTVTFPVFGISWFANPGDGTSILGFCGGGGSAKTGVHNFIFLKEPGSNDVMEISTGDKVGVALHIFQNPISNRIWLVVAMGKTVERYSLQGGSAAGTIQVDDGCNALAVNSMADRLAVGCESGLVKVYPMGDGELKSTPLFICEGHTKAICAVAFSPRGGRLVSSAKDGTASLWQDSKKLANLKCSVEDNVKGPKPKRPLQVLVRGCAFGDLEGKLIYTVASARRGKAYLSKWIQASRKIECATRTDCSAVPISAMSLSCDGGLLVLGSVDGSIILWGVENWKPLRVFKEVHDLPVTCIAARPYPVPLQGETDGVQMHAVSASADSQMAWLTLQRRAPRKSKSGGPSIFWSFVGALLNNLPWLAVFVWCIYIFILETKEKCLAGEGPVDYEVLQTCVSRQVLLADTIRPGISVPPH